jgi:RimJ/RimL family protein N-acetyltransferase
MTSSGKMEIRGDRILLRPFRSEELERWFMARLSSADDRTQQPLGPPDRERLADRIERSGTLHDGTLDLAIETEGALIGEISTYAEPGREMRPGLFFLAIGLFLPEDRGRGYGSEAIQLLCDWLFRLAGADRIESATAVTNASMRGVFDKLGFRFEGIERRWDVEWARYSLVPAIAAPRRPTLDR